MQNDNIIQFLWESAKSFRRNILGEKDLKTWKFLPKEEKDQFTQAVTYLLDTADTDHMPSKFYERTKEKLRKNGYPDMANWKNLTDQERAVQSVLYCLGLVFRPSFNCLLKFLD